MKMLFYQYLVFTDSSYCQKGDNVLSVDMIMPNEFTDFTHADSKGLLLWINK